MPHLTTEADRLVRATVDDFLAGKVKPDPLPETLYASKNSKYRVVAGRIHEASDASLTGAELVGFLVEDGKAVRIVALATHGAMREQGLSMGEPTKYLDEDSVAELLSVSVRTIQRWRGTGEGPPFIRAGARRVIYDPAHVNAWASTTPRN